MVQYVPQCIQGFIKQVKKTKIPILLEQQTKYEALTFVLMHPQRTWRQFAAKWADGTVNTSVYSKIYKVHMHSYEALVSAVTHPHCKVPLYYQLLQLQGFIKQDCTSKRIPKLGFYQISNTSMKHLMYPQMVQQLPNMAG